MERTVLFGVLCLMLAAVYPVAALGAPGDAVATITTPVPTTSCCTIGIAADCDGNLYYTNSFSDTLYMMDKFGAYVGQVPFTDAAGNAISFGAISWDATRDMIWAGTDSSGNPASVYLVDPATGLATYRFTGCIGPAGFTDGLAYDGTDNTLWFSDDVSEDICHYDTSGVFLGSITPTDPAGNILGQISGVLVGKGDILYIGRDGEGQIVKIDKTTGNQISMFATVGGRDEDLECDLINFAPLEVIWSKDAYDNTVSAIEVEEGTCICAGEPEIIPVDIDIKPTSCPNPFNTKSNGVLPVAILGTEVFDVSEVDPSTVTLEGVSPLRWAFEDVATPFEGDLCDCHELGPDGYMDLTLKFESQEILTALGAVTDGEYRPLTLMGETIEGTPISGQDCIWIKHKVHNTGAPPVISVGSFTGDASVIHLSLSEATWVSMVVYDVRGKRVKGLVNASLSSGDHTITWTGRDDAGKAVADGVYFCQVRAGSVEQTVKMLMTQ